MVRCPGCNLEYDIREATRDDALIAIIRMQGDFAAHSRLVFEYAELFGATRPIKAAKLLRILGEVRDFYASQRFSFQRQVYTISKDGMAQALKTVCGKRFTVPLENHNYLKKVMVSIAEAEGQQRSAEAEVALKKRESELRVRKERHNVTDTSAPSPIGDIAKNLPWLKKAKADGIE